MAHAFAGPLQDSFRVGQKCTSEKTDVDVLGKYVDVGKRRIVDEGFQCAHDVLTRSRAALDHMSRDLMECEVMDADHLKRILDEHRTSPQIKPGTFATTTPESQVDAADADNGEREQA